MRTYCGYAHSKINVKDFWSCIIVHLGDDQLQPFINAVLAGFIGKRASHMLPSPFENLASTERQPLMVL